MDYRTQDGLRITGQALKLPPVLRSSVLPTFRKPSSNRKSWSSNRQAPPGTGVEVKSSGSIVTSIQTHRLKLDWQAGCTRCLLDDQIKAGIGKKLCRFCRLRVLDTPEKTLFAEGIVRVHPKNRSPVQTSRWLPNRTRLRSRRYRVLPARGQCRAQCCRYLELMRSATSSVEMRVQAVPAAAAILEPRKLQRASRNRPFFCINEYSHGDKNPSRRNKGPVHNELDAVNHCRSEAIKS